MEVYLNTITVIAFIGFSCLFILPYALYRYTDVAVLKMHDADSEYNNALSGERGTLRKIEIYSYLHARSIVM